MRMQEGLWVSVLVLALGACSKPATPEMAAHDAAVAAANADAKDAKVAANEQQKVNDTQQSAGATADDVSHQVAVGNQAVADSAAKGDLDIALSKCESLSGSAKSACTNKAHVMYDAAKANAAVQRAKSDPQP